MRLSDQKLRRIVNNIGQQRQMLMPWASMASILHGHEGYLIEQLGNPAFNHRKLGRYADWRQFGLDMIKEIRRRVATTTPSCTASTFRLHSRKPMTSRS